MIHKIFQLINTFTKLFFLSKADKRFIRFSNNQFPPHASNDNYEGVVLFDQMYMDGYIFGRSYVTNFFKQKFNYQIAHYHFIHRERKILRWSYFFLRNFSRIEKLYSSFGSSFALGQTYFKKSELIANNLKFHSKRELLEYKYEGILFGDLVYDTYLRSYAEPTVDLDDHRLKLVLINALDIYFSINDYYDNHNVKKVILSHSVYIQYGLVARVALSKNIDVYNFPWESIVHKLTLDHPTPHVNHLMHRKYFAKKDNQSDLLQRAKDVLEKRLSGSIDPGIAYMKKSAYEQSNDYKKVFLHDGRPKVVLMLHCFYDAPHIFKTKVFEDFYEWVTFIFDLVPDMNIDFVVKPHPNAKPLNERILKDIQLIYPKVRFLDDSISSVDIIKDGAEFMLTVYGTAVHEFAYQDITVLTAGDHPAAAYSFSVNSISKEEFKENLLNIRDINLQIDKNEILEFFYMQYLNPQFGRVEGNNDLFLMRKRDYENDKNIFFDMVADAENGMFDNVYNAIEKALIEVDLT
ncbi:hypothetical protein N9R49_02205 [Gammaproteobacteria bacterium]|nr:hypothetical protein [Gammaproteobacteria bacterium]